MSSKINNLQISHNKLKYFVLIAFLVTILGLATYWFFIANNKDTSIPEPNATTTSTAATAQANFTDGDQRNPGNTISEDKGSGTIEDKQGTTTTQTDSSTWTRSNTGEITVYTPPSNSVIETGIEVSGESSLPAVSFRLIDNISGIIAQGELRVVDGKFSGVLTFNTSAVEGRFDVFGNKPDGVEFSNIEIPVRFK